jgi:hypothetical protein
LAREQIWHADPLEVESLRTFVWLLAGDSKDLANLASARSPLNAHKSC